VTILLTTTDNPYDPFDEWDQWYNFDRIKGYDTPGLVSRLVATSSNVSEADQDVALDQAIQAVLDINPNGLYITVMRE
jgi:hypothetical protein